MDTDDLTPMAYACIMSAYGVADTLAIELGAAAKNHSTEEEYLKGILTFVIEIESHPMDYLESWNLDDIDLNSFRAKVSELRRQIEKTIQTLFSDRGPVIDW